MTEDSATMQPALWGVYFAAAGLRRAVLPPAVRPTHLSGTLDVLRRHVDRHGGARRRRALFEVGRAGLHREAVRDDVAGKAIALAHDLGVEPAMLDAAGTAAARDVLAARAPDAGAIAVKPGPVEARYLPRTHESSIEATVLVNRPVRDLHRLLDPQCWKESSDFFAVSDRIEPDTGRPTPSAPGVSWEGHILEDFRVPVASFENVLGIRFIASDHMVHVDYRLYDSRCFSFAGQRMPGVHELDDGFVHAVPLEDRPEWTKITMKKSIVFRDLTPRRPARNGIDHGQWLNYSAPAMLCLWVDDTSQARLGRL